MASHEQVFLFLAHQATFANRRAFRCLEEQASSLGDVCWLFDACRGSIPRSVRSRQHYPFSAAQIGALHYPMMQRSLLPGHAHFPLLCFFRDHPDYRYYWTVEYDVRFTGSWSSFFDEFSADPADLLTSHIRPYAEEPDWPWWFLEHPREEIPRAARLRAFSTIFRTSRAALACLDRDMRDGWCGHQEVLVPTLLQHRGLRVADIGGAGFLTPPGRRNRLYVDSLPNIQGALRTGTMRFRPSFWRPGREKGLLYHPIKPLSQVLYDQYKEMRYRLRALRARKGALPPTNPASP